MLFGWIWIGLCVAHACAYECSPHSLAVLSYRLFDRKGITCAIKNGPDELCEMGFLWPTSISCSRLESKMPSPWTPRSQADEYARGAWRCESDRSWVQHAFLVCPGNATACDTVVRDSCHAEFDPTMALAYVVILVVGCASVFGCLCCLGLCGYMLHCACRESRRRVYSSSSSRIITP